MKNFFVNKYLSLFIAAILLIGCLAACGSETEPDVMAKDTLSIVATIFPEYDWVQNILGDNPAEVEVTMLLDSGVDLHSYQPTADDILKISTCDLFIYVGGESDKWVEDALQEAANKDMIVINLLDALGDRVREEELVEGMETDEDEDKYEDADADKGKDKDIDADKGKDEEEEEEPEYDEHVWLSLKNASYLAAFLSDAIQSIDAAHREVYISNAEAYMEKLKALDDAYQSAVTEADVSTLLFGDRFPFRYLTDDYGLSYYAAFAGCSAETEASFETITFLAQKVDELSLQAVMTIEGSDQRIAETIVQNTLTKDQQILTMDSMQSTTLRDTQNGTTYLSIMENNLETLKEALNCK